MDHIAIVTDSTADIPEELAERHNIHVVPNILVIDGRSVEDGKGISRQEFYTNLPNMKAFPTTATASSGTYHQLYQRLFQEGFSQILSIHAASLLSGIFNAASLAAQAFGECARVIDSHFVTLGLGFQALAAAEAARHIEAHAQSAGHPGSVRGGFYKVHAGSVHGILYPRVHIPAAVVIPRGHIARGSYQVQVRVVYTADIVRVHGNLRTRRHFPGAITHLERIDPGVIAGAAVQGFATRAGDRGRDRLSHRAGVADQCGPPRRSRRPYDRPHQVRRQVRAGGSRG